MAKSSKGRILLSAVAAAAATGLCQIASASDVPDARFVPPRMSQPAEGYGNCHAAVAPPSGENARVSTHLTVGVDGYLTKISLPESSPDWMVELTACVLRKLTFTPATRSGTAVESIVNLPISFEAAGETETAVTVVRSVGPLITPPRIGSRTGGVVDQCFPLGLQLRGHSGSVLAKLTILPDGTATEMKLPAGTPSWMIPIAQCVVESVTFMPGLKDGVPTTAEATLPIVIRNWWDTAQTQVKPALVSNEAELEAAYRDCYPQDLQAEETVVYRLVLGVNGRVQSPQVLVSSGEARIDEAGTCVLKRLRFTPVKRGNQALKSTATFSLLVRPARAL